MPMFRVSDTPVFSLWMTWTRESARVYESQMAPELSVLPSSTSSSSKSVYCWLRMLSTQRPMVFSALYTGTMMLTVGAIELPS